MMERDLNQPGDGMRTGVGRSGRRAFTLVDILVTIAVIAVLIGLLLPSVSMVRESARRVVCSSDLRQLGLGINMYAEDNRSILPESVFLEEVSSREAFPIAPHLMDTVRTDADEFSAREWGQWDGLGLLFSASYIEAPSVFYCPSHTGENRESDNIDRWDSALETELVSNFQYRGVGPDGQRMLTQIDSNAALVTDTVRSVDHLNHDDGFNILAADLSVNWFSDVDQQVLLSIMSRTEESIIDDVRAEWGIFDRNPVE